MPRPVLTVYSGNLGHIRRFNRNNSDISRLYLQSEQIVTFRYALFLRKIVFTSLRFSEVTLVLERFRFLRNIPSLPCQTPSRLVIGCID